METVEQKLDCLADYEAQRDLIEINKRAALEEIKVPAEIQAIVSDGMKRINGTVPASSEFISKNEMLDAKLKALVIPDDVKEILAKIDAQRADIEAKRQELYKTIENQERERRAAIQLEIDAATKKVYADLALRKAEIEEEFAGKVEAVNSNIEALKAEIKKETIAARQTFKGKFYQSIFTNGRVTWDLAMMEAWRATFPFLEKARKEGEPSTQLRKI